MFFFFPTNSTNVSFSCYLHSRFLFLLSAFLLIVPYTCTYVPWSFNLLLCCLFLLPELVSPVPAGSRGDFVMLMSSFAFNV